MAHYVLRHCCACGLSGKIAYYTLSLSPAIVQHDENPGFTLFIPLSSQVIASKNVNIISSLSR
ncbi:hypothetical protein CPI84_07780 [Erwinia pyrifoliae]|nr:hypothetical protein CPI84_07780 [Erwinia pyrifoliae]MCA8877372.1 hypothetical protein [Erwinia pyrifoliae]